MTLLLSLPITIVGSEKFKLNFSFIKLYKSFFIAGQGTPAIIHIRLPAFSAKQVKRYYDNTSPVPTDVYYLILRVPYCVLQFILFNTYFLYCTIMDMGNETVDNRLTDFLNEGKDWERKQTNVPGVFLLKLPAFRSRPACIAIEIDALGRGGGGGNRRRGLIIRSKEEIEQLSNILTNDKVIELASAVEKVNPIQTTSSTVDSEVFEI
jgi:hypothetical protein